MIDLIPHDLEPVPYLAVALAVSLLGAARLHASDRWWCPNLAWFWWPIRRVLWPPLDHALASVPGAYAKTTVSEREVINHETWDITLEELHEHFADVGYEAQPLASIARYRHTDELERSSLAYYAGPKPFGLEGLPEWLRRYQVHVRPFGPDGHITVTAHHEYNPWRPGLALPHLLGIGLNAERGVEIAAAHLGVSDDQLGSRSALATLEANDAS